MKPSSPTADTPTDAKRSPRSVLIIVFTTILIDFIGFSVLIPVLPLYAERLGATELEVALILTVYALSQLLFLPAWGWVSDRVGRRPVILVSLLGTTISFVVLAAADTIGMIYLARALAGFFAASIGTAQAVVTDVTTPGRRARGMGVIGAAFGAGLVVGPMIGGTLAEVGEKVPFYAIAVLAGANLIVAWARLPESKPASRRYPGTREFAMSLVPAPLRLIAAVHDRRIGLYLYLFLHVFVSFAVLESLITLYLGIEFGLGPFRVALIFAWIGIVLFLTQGALLRPLVQRFGETGLVSAGLAMMAVGLAAVALAPSYAWFFPVAAVIAFGNGIAFPSFTSLFSKACEAEQAGELLGQSQSMATTGRILGPIGGGLVMERVAMGAPFVIAGAMMFVALVIFLALRRVLVRDPE
jgi:multidrug resistance protein